MTQQEAINLIKAYLDALLKRDVATAAQFIQPGAKIIYPGGKSFATLDTLSESSSKKFKSLTKHYDKFDSFEQDNLNIVYVLGTLDGVWPDDTTFKGIRFIDRYEIKDGLIISQDVWSDSAEFRLAKLAA